MIWNEQNRKTLAELADEQDDREAEEYAAMYEKVAAEYRGTPKSTIAICAETMRRLREKYSA